MGSIARTQFEISLSPHVRESHQEHREEEELARAIRDRVPAR